jgi:hypothetical protein
VSEQPVLFSFASFAASAFNREAARAPNGCAIDSKRMTGFQRSLAVLQGNGKAMRSAATWFLILAGVCIAGPYLLGVRPKTPRERQYVAVTIAFLAWVLLLMAALRSR